MYTHLRPYASTERQAEILEVVIAEGSLPKAAVRLGITERNVTKAIRRIRLSAAEQGLAPDHDMSKPVPDGYKVKGVSTLYDMDGNLKAQWVKSQSDPGVKAQEAVEAAVAAFKAELPKYKAGRYTQKKVNKDLIPWFQIGDAHIGMLAHHFEVGHNFNMKIAKEEMCEAIGELIDRCEPCERCVIQDMGDFTHYENFAGVTEASGNQMDFDSRFPKMIDIYVATMRFIIESALEKFKFVDVIINQGNHSRTNDIWARKFISETYDPKRVTAINNSNVFIPYRMGNTFVMSHHSDKCKPARLANVMATDYRHDFGEAKYKYIDIGHIHTRSAVVETGDVIIESWNQLAPNEKYAHEAGGDLDHFYLSFIAAKRMEKRGALPSPPKK